MADTGDSSPLSWADLAEAEEAAAALEEGATSQGDTTEALGADETEAPGAEESQGDDRVQGTPEAPGANTALGVGFPEEGRQRVGRGPRATFSSDRLVSSLEVARARAPAASGRARFDARILPGERQPPATGGGSPGGVVEPQTGLRRAQGGRAAAGGAAQKTPRAPIYGSSRTSGMYGNVSASEIYGDTSTFGMYGDSGSSEIPTMYELMTQINMKLNRHEAAIEALLELERGPAVAQGAAAAADRRARDAHADRQALDDTLNYMFPAERPDGQAPGANVNRRVPQGTVKSVIPEALGAASDARALGAMADVEALGADSKRARGTNADRRTPQSGINEIEEEPPDLVSEVSEDERDERQVRADALLAEQLSLESGGDRPTGHTLGAGHRRAAGPSAPELGAGLHRAADPSAPELGVGPGTGRHRIAGPSAPKLGAGFGTDRAGGGVRSSHIVGQTPGSEDYAGTPAASSGGQWADHRTNVPGRAPRTGRPSGNSGHTESLGGVRSTTTPSEAVSAGMGAGTRRSYVEAARPVHPWAGRQDGRWGATPPTTGTTAGAEPKRRGESEPEDALSPVERANERARKDRGSQHGLPDRFEGFSTDHSVDDIFEEIRPRATEFLVVVDAWAENVRAEHGPVGEDWLMRRVAKVFRGRALEWFKALTQEARTQLGAFRQAFRKKWFSPLHLDETRKRIERLRVSKFQGAHRLTQYIEAFQSERTQASLLLSHHMGEEELATYFRDRFVYGLDQECQDELSAYGRHHDEYLDWRRLPYDKLVKWLEAFANDHASRIRRQRRSGQADTGGARGFRPARRPPPTTGRELNAVSSEIAYHEAELNALKSGKANERRPIRCAACGNQWEGLRVGLQECKKCGRQWTFRSGTPGGGGGKTAYVQARDAAKAAGVAALNTEDPSAHTEEPTRDDIEVEVEYRSGDETAGTVNPGGEQGEDSDSDSGAQSEEL